MLPEGLSLAGFGVLNHFIRLKRDAERPTQLARNFQVAKSAMTNTLQRLESAGYITLEPDPEDGRGKIARITPSGRAARDASIARLQPVMAEFSPCFLRATSNVCFPRSRGFA
ncbi:MAG: MarR family transcriptional regulator [Caulobacteraceae bacterium]|nr:MarR family transcriptional regulator [Caulobacteraceae bacterium]